MFGYSSFNSSFFVSAFWIASLCDLYVGYPLESRLVAAVMISKLLLRQRPQSFLSARFLVLLPNCPQSFSGHLPFPSPRSRVSASTRRFLPQSDGLLGPGIPVSFSSGGSSRSRLLSPTSPPSPSLFVRVSPSTSTPRYSH